MLDRLKYVFTQLFIAVMYISFGIILCTTFSLLLLWTVCFGFWSAILLWVTGSVALLICWIITGNKIFDYDKFYNILDKITFPMFIIKWIIVFFENYVIKYVDKDYDDENA